MKFLFLVITIALIAFAYHTTRKNGPHLAPGATRPSPTAIASLPDRTSWNRAEFVEVRGRVLDVVPEGLIVQTVSPAVSTTRAQGRDAAAARRSAAATIDREYKEFGPVTAIENGRLQPTQLRPAALATGTILLNSHPNERKMIPGDKFDVVAAPLENAFPYQGTRLRAYTMSYVIPPEAPGAWKWQPRSNPLEAAPR